MIFISLFACAELFSADESSETNSWAGYAYQQTLDQESELTQMEEGSIILENIYGEEITRAEQPYEDTPSYWQFQLEKMWLNQETQIRIEGNSETTLPMLWRSKTPTKDANWLSGAFYTQELGFTKSYFSTFLPEGMTTDFDDTSVSHLWGQPLIPEDWSEVEIRLYDGNNEEIEVYSYHLLENGAISDNTANGVTWFFAWNIPAGKIRLEIETSAGEFLETMYYSRGGEVLSAHFYALPQEEE